MKSFLSIIVLLFSVNLVNAQWWFISSSDSGLASPSVPVPDTSFALNDSTGFVADTTDYGQDTSKTYTIIAENTTWSFGLADGTELAVDSLASSFNLVYTPTTEGEYLDTVTVTPSVGSPIILPFSGVGRDTTIASEWVLLWADTSFNLGLYTGGDGKDMWWSGGNWTITGGAAVYDGTNLKSILWDSLYAVPNTSMDESNVYIAPGDSIKIRYELDTGASIVWKCTLNDQANTANLIVNNWNYPTEIAGIYEKLDINDAGVYLTKAQHLCLTSTGGNVLWYKVWRKAN